MGKKLLEKAEQKAAHTGHLTQNKWSCYKQMHPTGIYYEYIYAPFALYLVTELIDSKYSSYLTRKKDLTKKPTKTIYTEFGNRSTISQTWCLYFIFLPHRAETFNHPDMI